jgi:single-stranded-DNA-specific exonuclease
VRDFDLYEAIGQCSDLLESYGGHMYAAGLTMKIENIPAFRQRFEEIVTSQITDMQQIQTIDVDAIIPLSEITPRFYRILKQFAPFGPHNMLPVFVTEDVFDAGTSRLVGKNQEHLKLDLVEPDVNSGIFPGIAFNQSDAYDLITSGLPFDVCYSITENEYRGKTNLQLFIKDIKKRDIF